MISEWAIPHRLTRNRLILASASAKVDDAITALQAFDRTEDATAGFPYGTSRGLIRRYRWKKR